MLKYLIATQGNKIDTQAVVVWATDDGRAMEDPLTDSYGLYNEQPQTEGAKLQNAHIKLETDYAKKFRDLHSSKGDIEEFGAHSPRSNTLFYEL